VSKPQKKKTVSSKWVKLFSLLPGYDPIATREDCCFDEDAASKAISFFESYLSHVKGEKAKKPFLLEPWQQAIIGCIFGWKRPDETRRYREVFILIPRKNGKTALAAGIALYVMFCDGEKGAEIYSAAAERDQAALVFEHAKGMVLQNPKLSGHAQIYTKAITIESIGASYKAISADANTKHGFNTHFAVIDELHAQKNRELVDVLKTSTGARRQPLIVHITTSDYDRPSICNELYDYASKVRDGIINASQFMPVIYEAKPEDDWQDPKVWAKANPNLGVSIGLNYFREAFNEALEKPTCRNTFKRLHLNIRTEQDVLWLPMEKWDACHTFDMNELEGKECYAGIDLASTSDISAFVLFFPESCALLPFFWVPSSTAVKRQRDRVPYQTWIDQQLMEKTEGDVVDYDVIRRRVNEIGKVYNIQEIAIDRWNSTHLQTQLTGDGFTVVPFGQGFASMSAPSKELEKLVVGGELSHNNNPVLRWMASNVAAETDAAANIKPSKKKSSEKIDGIVAAVMAIGRAMVRTDSGVSIYEAEGIKVL
jgi:phage terminase large subunit-like protein